MPTSARCGASSRAARPSAITWAPNGRRRCGRSWPRWSASPAGPSPNRSRPAAPAIPPSSTPRRNGRARSLAGYRRGPISRPSSTTRGAGFRSVGTSRAGHADVAAARSTARSAALGRDAGLQRVGDHCGDHSPRARGAAADRADRGGRLFDRRHPRPARHAAGRARLRAAAAATEPGQGGGAAPRVRSSDRQHRGHPGRRPGVFAGGVAAAHRAGVRRAGRRRLRLAVSRPPPGVPLHALPGNRVLTLLTNVLYNTMLTDMETCYKVMRTEVLRSMTLESNGFGIEPELTAKIFRRKLRVYEVPISYDGRGYDEGKKIGWRDGVVAVWVLLKYRFGE